MRLILCLLVCIPWMSGCGNLQNLANKSRAKRQQKAMEKLAETSSEEAAARLGANAVGQVAYVDDAEQFLLIRTLEGLALPAGAALETREGGKQTAVLQTTAERKDSFVAADILQGHPRAGESIYPSKVKVSQPVAGLPVPVSPATGTAAGSSSPAVPAMALPQPVPAPAAGFDPANLPRLEDPIEKPEDLRRP